MTAHLARWLSHARRDQASAQLEPLLEQQSPTEPTTHSASLVHAVCSTAAVVGSVGVGALGVTLFPEEHEAPSKPNPRARRLSPGKWRFCCSRFMFHS